MRDPRPRPRPAASDRLALGHPAYRQQIVAAALLIGGADAKMWDYLVISVLTVALLRPRTLCHATFQDTGYDLVRRQRKQGTDYLCERRKRHPATR